MIARVRVWALLLASALCYALGAISARALAARHSARYAADFAQPLVVVTSWHGYGVAAFTRLALTILAATALLVVACRFAHLERRADATVADLRDGDLRSVVAIAAIALVGCAAWPFVFSSDAYAYAAYGQMALDGIDPYRLVPAHATGPYVNAARFQWDGAYPVCVYGPFFVAAARAIVVATKVSGVAATLWVFRVVGACAFLASIVAFGAIARRIPMRSRFIALAAYGLNPAALWSVAEGHNDALLALLALGGIALVLGAISPYEPAARTDPEAARISALLGRFAPLFGAGVVGISAALKGTGLVFAAVLGFGLAGPWRDPRGRLLGAVLASSVVLAAIATLPRMWPAFAALGHDGRYAPSASVQSLIGVVPTCLITLACAGYGMWRIGRGEWRALAWIGIAAWLALPNPYAWYALWLGPLATLSGGGAAAIALWGATISSVVRYLPDAAGASSVGEGRLVAVVAAIPLALLFGASKRRFFSQKATSKP